MGYFYHNAYFRVHLHYFYKKNLPMKSILIPVLIFLINFSHLTAQNFSEAEKLKILSGDTTTMLKVLINADVMDMEVLGAMSRDIDPADPLLPLLSRRMFLSMRDTSNPGVGIAAPQVGINRNAIWIQRFDKSGSPFEFLINPRVLKASLLSRKGGEGCLSVPDERGELIRSYAIMIEYQSFDGGWHTEMLEDFSAVIFQHEYDHLQGILFPDRMRMQQNELALPLPEGVQLLIRPTVN
jgi:peptide deformylase